MRFFLVFLGLMLYESPKSYFLSLNDLIELSKLILKKKLKKDKEKKEKKKYKKIEV